MSPMHSACLDVEELQTSEAHRYSIYTMEKLFFSPQGTFVVRAGNT